MQRILFSLFLSTFTLLSSAQFRAGFHYGVNFATTTGNNSASNLNMLPGNQGGVTFDFYKQKGKALRTGIFFSQRGYDYNNYYYASNSEKLYTKYNYIELPVLFRKERQKNAGRTSWLIGGTLSVGVSYSKKYMAYYDSAGYFYHEVVFEKNKFANNPQYNQIEIGVMMGIEHNFILKNGHLVVSAVFQQGINSPVYAGNNSYYSSRSFNNCNSGLRFMLGYVLPAKKKEASGH